VQRHQVVIELSKDGKRIDLFSAYFHGVSEMCKSINGSRAVYRVLPSMEQEFSHWSYPKDISTCRRMRDVFGAELLVGTELAEWARAEIEHEKKFSSLVKQTDAELQRVSDRLPAVAKAMESRTYQRVGAAFMAQSTHGGLILADQPGLGKTIQTFAGIVERGIEEGLHLVACPATAVNIVWSKEVRKWTDFAVFSATGTDKARHDAIDAALVSRAPVRFLIINPEMARIRLGRWCQKCKMFEEAFSSALFHENHIRGGHKTQPRPLNTKFPELFEHEFSSITVDESHRFLSGIKGPHSKTQVGEGLCRLKVKEGGLKIALSGTPMKGDPVKLWGALHWGAPGVYTSRWRWAQNYFNISEDQYSQTIGALVPEREQEFYKSLDSVMLRRTKGEVAKDLPPKQLDEHWVELHPAQKKQYRDILRTGETMFGKKNVSVTGVLAELTRLKQIAIAYQGADGPVLSKSSKWMYLLELLEERGVVGPKDDRFGTDKFVIASQFTQIVDAMYDEFKAMGIPTLRITGDVSVGDRLRAQEAFQAEGGIRIMLINTMAGGVAIDLDQHCDELFFLDESWIPDDQEQVEDRIHRVSRMHNVTIHYLYSKESIDEAIANSNITKDQIQKKIMDGRRGVEFAIRLLKEIKK
jgi:SNF2 family DNA or RNA helicase